MNSVFLIEGEIEYTSSLSFSCGKTMLTKICQSKEFTLKHAWRGTLKYHILKAHLSRNAGTATVHQPT